ncbi:hypothetical protein AX16_004427 [Volvariella volvacea WC 439]|nr:hypothetical protein AX16_004427 [Volvariella volvacea WC 439]
MPLFKSNKDAPPTHPSHATGGTGAAYGQTGAGTTGPATGPTAQQPGYAGTTTTGAPAGVHQTWDQPSVPRQMAHDTGASLKSGVGRAEQATGAVFGSDRMKATGAERQAEAEASRYRNADLAEAERLEQEARLHRERAAGMGPGYGGTQYPGGTGTGRYP